MGMEIKLFNKNAAQAEIAKEKERTERHKSNNETKVKTNSNKTNLLTEVVKVVGSVASTLLDNSKKDGD